MKKEKDLFDNEEKFTLFGSSKLKNVECTSLIEVLPGGVAFVISLFLYNMSEQEQTAIKTSKLMFRTIKNSDSTNIITLMKIEGTELIFELNFDPRLYRDQRVLEVIRTSNDIYIVGVESKDLKIKSSRKNKVPIKLLNEWLNVWNKQKESDEVKNKYNEWLDSLIALDIDELWRMGKPSGYIQ